MKLNLLAFAIIGFLLFMGLEYLLSRKTGKNYFQFAESVANINVGIAERLLDVFTTGVFYFFFVYIHDQFALFNIKPHWATWLALLLFTDFIWYWYHRLAHEVNILWAAHVVHHQSEDFNYTVSARITVFQAALRSLFWAVLPFIGFPPAMITSLLLVHGLYPFFIHTQTIGKLGIPEHFMVTPSHHRVHHSSNEEYLDKNYGDVFIIWDQLFGTFVKEKDDVKCVYGLTTPLKSYSFLWQQFHFMLELLTAFRRAKGFKAKWIVIFGKPDDIDPGIRPELEQKWLFAPEKAKNTRFQRIYIVLQTSISIILLFFVVLFEKIIPGGLAALSVLFILISLVNTGAILEQRKWIFYLEYSRMLVILLALVLYFPHLYAIGTALFAILLVTLYFRTCQQRFDRILYQRVN
ncbi:sterol desaturase family protein [Chitinophaga sedimenti]|uniref:sterol desaturase family protein n=1 Tax=Chitinophaga sedimenti TaxID=2033606 RepID=UPI00200427AD|nr:sterol desaturase family protein [Chitinophaga sedimenti]MCK7554598.1 sterol desaturase family protein [Chitinophaga sedimenti]